MWFPYLFSLLKKKSNLQVFQIIGHFLTLALTLSMIVIQTRFYSSSRKSSSDIHKRFVLHFQHSNSISITAAGSRTQLSQPFQSAAYTDAPTTDCYVWGYDKALWECCLSTCSWWWKKNWTSLAKVCNVGATSCKPNTEILSALKLTWGHNSCLFTHSADVEQH